MEKAENAPQQQEEKKVVTKGKKGAKGATLIWEKMNDKILLSLKIAAKEIAKTVWNPKMETNQ